MKWHIPAEPPPPRPDPWIAALAECPHKLGRAEHENRMHTVGFVFRSLPDHWTDAPVEIVGERYVKCGEWRPVLGEREKLTDAWYPLSRDGHGAKRVEAAPRVLGPAVQPSEAREPEPLGLGAGGLAAARLAASLRAAARAAELARLAAEGPQLAECQATQGGEL